jgi:predicted nuclease with TOPRIM domain
MGWVEILNIVIPVVTALAGWLAGIKKRKNDFLADMQASIDMLADKNKVLLDELVTIREENVKLHAELDRVTTELESLNEEIKGLRESKRELKDLRILRKKYEKMLADNNISYL